MSANSPDFGPNPYASPPKPQSLHETSQGNIASIVIAAICVILGIFFGGILAVVSYFALLLGVFGDSTEYWPALACLPPATLVFAFVIWLFAIIIRRGIIRLAALEQR